MTNTLPKPVEAFAEGVGLSCADCGRRVVDAVLPPEGEPYFCRDCAPPSETPEDELTRAALADPGVVELRDLRATPWRGVALLAIAVAALAVLFWKR